MTQIFKLPQILKTLDQLDLVKSMSIAFVNVSKKNVLLPPIGEMLFPKSNGELHIKYGAIDNDEDFVVKLATGFFDNPSKGLPPFSGCMLVFSQATGILKAVLLEEGELTNHRTAAAGAVAAKLLAPKKIKKIGIVGTGVQARLQASYLRKITDCRDLTIWGRNSDKAEHAAQDLAELDFNCTVSKELSSLTQESNLIVTTTPSIKPLITASMISPGTHITAMGSDTAEKCELSPALLAMADIVATDSTEQAIARGEISQAIRAGQISSNKIVELGEIIINSAKGRQTENQITISDLSGVAAQDIIIAKEVTKILEKG
jgi:ornithine cyclodeaminase